MTSKTILLLFGLMTITLAFSSKQIKSLFVLQKFNGFAPNFYNTENGILAYLPMNSQYFRFDITDTINPDANVILSDLVQSCGQQGSLYDRLHYHYASSTLVYYCGASNILLILNEYDYTINGSIPLDVNGTFSEVRIYSEGDSVVILGMGPLGSYSVPTQLITVDLQVKEIVRQVIFNSGLASEEVVTAYASNDFFSYVLTSTPGQSKNIMNIYDVVFIENSYDLVRVATFDSMLGPQPTLYLSDIFLVDEYIVTNDRLNMLFYNTKGIQFTRIPGLSFKVYGEPQEMRIYNPIIAMKSGSSKLYSIRDNYAVEMITIKNQTITSKRVAVQANDVHLALASQTNSELLFSVENGASFTIKNAETFSLVYSAPIVNFDNLYITNSTFAGTYASNIYVYDIKTNSPVYTGRIYTESSETYYDQSTQTLYYLNKCSVNYLNLETLANGTSYTFNSSFNCYGQIIHVKNNSNPLSPEFVIESGFGQYFIVTNAYGPIQFFPFTGTLGAYTLIPNYDDMSFYFATVTSTGNTNISHYVYNSSSRSFYLETSSLISNLPAESPTSLSIIDSETLAFIYNSTVAVLTLSMNEFQQKTVPGNTTGSSAFHDNTGDLYLALSSTLNYYDPAFIDVSNQGVEPVWNVGNFTDSRTAGSAGYSTFWISAGRGLGVLELPFGLTKFYRADLGNKKEKSIYYDILQGYY